MIIEGDVFEDIKMSQTASVATLSQASDIVLIDKKQAVQLIAELQRWVDGEEIE